MYNKFDPSTENPNKSNASLSPNYAPREFCRSADEAKIGWSSYLCKKWSKQRARSESGLRRERESLGRKIDDGKKKKKEKK